MNVNITCPARLGMTRDWTTHPFLAVADGQLQSRQQFVGLLFAVSTCLVDQHLQLIMAADLVQQLHHVVAQLVSQRQVVRLDNEGFNTSAVLQLDVEHEAKTRNKSVFTSNIYSWDASSLALSYFCTCFSPCSTSPPWPPVAALWPARRRSAPGPCWTARCRLR